MWGKLNFGMQFCLLLYKNPRILSIKIDGLFFGVATVGIKDKSFCKDSIDTWIAKLQGLMSKKYYLEFLWLYASYDLFFLLFLQRQFGRYEYSYVNTNTLYINLPIKTSILIMYGKNRYTNICFLISIDPPPFFSFLNMKLAKYNWSLLC